MKSNKRIITNSVNMVLALSIRKILTFTYVTLIAKYSELYITGLFFYLMSILTVLGLVMDLGLSPLFIRESSKNIDSIKKYLGATIGIKIILCPLGVISALYIVWLTNYPAITKQLLYMIIFMMVLDSFSMTFFGCFRAKQRLE